MQDGWEAASEGRGEGTHRKPTGRGMKASLAWSNQGNPMTAAHYGDKPESCRAAPCQQT